MGELSARGAPPWAVEVSGLGRTFGATVVLRNVDLRAATGEIMVLLGPNGAGKTTLLKVLATLIRPTAGTGRILGYDLRRDVGAIRAEIGVLSHKLYLYEDLTALENLRFFQTMWGLNGRDGHLMEALEAVDLASVARGRVREFSHGMKRRLAFARLRLQRPRLLLLDEPFAGLDQQGTKTLERYLVGFREEGRSVLMTTHRLGQGLELADRLAILSEGRVVFQDQKSQMGLQDLERLYHSLTGPAP